MPEPPASRPRLLLPGDPVEMFDCGVETLNRYIRRHALQSQRSHAARTYVAWAGEAIVGYYTLVFSSVEHEVAPERLKKGLARHPIPVMLLARLAVDKRFQGRGWASQLLRDALLRTLAAADIAGLRAVLVQAKDEKARNFYEHFGFDSFPGDPLKLVLLTKDLREIAG